MQAGEHERALPQPATTPLVLDVERPRVAQTPSANRRERNSSRHDRNQSAVGEFSRLRNGRRRAAVLGQLELERPPLELGPACLCWHLLSSPANLVCLDSRHQTLQQVFHMSSVHVHRTRTDINVFVFIEAWTT